MSCTRCLWLVTARRDSTSGILRRQGQAIRHVRNDGGARKRPYARSDRDSHSTHVVVAFFFLQLFGIQSHLLALKCAIPAGAILAPWRMFPRGTTPRRATEAAATLGRAEAQAICSCLIAYAIAVESDLHFTTFLPHSARSFSLSLSLLKGKTDLRKKRFRSLSVKKKAAKELWWRTTRSLSPVAKRVHLPLMRSLRMTVVSEGIRAHPRSVCRVERCGRAGMTIRGTTRFGICSR